MADEKKRPSRSRKSRDAARRPAGRSKPSAEGSKRAAARPADTKASADTKAQRYRAANLKRPAAIRMQRRRRTGWAMVLLGAALVPIYLVINDGGGESTQQPEAGALPNSVHATATGISVGWPDGWKQSKRVREKAIVLKSANEALLISISTPAAVREARGVRESAIQAIKENYEVVSVQPGRGRIVGGLPSTGAVIDAKSKNGDRLRILVVVGRGKKRTYLTEFFASAGVDVSTLAQAQVILNSIELSK